MTVIGFQAASVSEADPVKLQLKGTSKNGAFLIG